MATPNSRSVFVEDDDSDSVNSDSTVQSDFEAEYSVEKILAERKTDQGVSLYLVKWEGYQLHRSTWEPRENFVDFDCLVNWELHKRDINEGRAKPFKIAKFDAAVRLDQEQRERRHAKRAEKRRRKALLESRGHAPRRRLLSRKELSKKGTARKVSTRDATPSSASGESPKRQGTPLFEPSTTSGSAGRKRKRPLSDPHSPSPALSVDDVSNSQYSMFNEPTTTSTEGPRKSPSPHSTIVPKRARVNDPPSGKETSKQRSGTTTNVVASRPKSSNSPSVHNKPQTVEAPSQAAAHKDKSTERARSEAVSGSSKPQPSKSAESSTVPDLSTVSSKVAQRRASDATPASALTESRENSLNRNVASNAISKSHAAVADHQSDLRPSPATNAAPKSVARPAGPFRKQPIKLFVESTKVKPKRPRVNEYTPKDSTDAQFTHLSMQRRMQLYSHNEPAPDPNALKFVDANTGKILDSTNGTPSTSSTLRLDTNVARNPEVVNSATASGSAHALDNRSVSISAPQRGSSQGRGTTPGSAQETEPRFAYPSARPTASRFSRKHITCRFWYRGTCNKSEAECPNAHTWTGRLDDKRAATCTFWEERRCKFSDEECEYFHGYDYQRTNGTGRGSLEDANGFRAAQQTRRRSESPDRYGLRQDEAEGRRDRMNLSHFKPRPDERTPITSPSLTSTTSLEPRNGTARYFHMNRSGLHSGLTDEPPLNMGPTPDVAMPDAQDEIDTADPVNMCLSIRPASPPIYTLDLKLVFDTKASRTKFLDTVGENSSLEGSDICRSRDFEAYWYSNDKVWASGGVICAPGDTVATYLEDFLVLHSSCVAIRTNDFVLVVYPTQNPDWKFMPHRGPEKSGLRWYLQAAEPGTLEPIITKPTKSSFLSMCAEHLDLNPEILFAGNKGKRIEKAVYLFFPKGAPESKLVEAFLNEIGAKFFYSEDFDLWNQFCGKGATVNRVILFHPLMNTFWRLPEFWNILATGVNIFQVGVSKSIKYRPDSSLKYNCTRLFPNGTLTLITDDVFKYHPALALRVLGVYEGFKLKPEGGRNDRIYCRPGILAWLAELIDEDREKGTLTEDSPRIRCWQLACELLGIAAAENTRNPFRSDKAPPSVLYSPPKSEMPDYGPMWDSSEEEASDFLVNWFAGHGVEECENYRRFHVLYEQHGALAAQTPGVLQPDNPKDPREWMKKYTHIKVTTPARYLMHLENYEKSKKGAR